MYNTLQLYVYEVKFQIVYSFIILLCHIHLYALSSIKEMQLESNEYFFFKSPFISDGVDRCTDLNFYFWLISEGATC